MKKRVRTYFFVGEWIPWKGEIRNFGHEWVEPFPVPPLAANLDRLLRIPWGVCLSNYCNNFEKSGRESFFILQSNKVTACKVRDRKIVDGAQSTYESLFISKSKLFKVLVKLKLQPARIFNWLLIGLNTKGY